MGTAQIALDPSPPLCQTGKRRKKVLQTVLASPYTPGQTWGKKCSKPSWQAFTTPRQMCGKKCPKPSWQAFTSPPLTGNAHMEATHFEKGLPLLGSIKISFGDYGPWGIFHCAAIRGVFQDLLLVAKLKSWKFDNLQSSMLSAWAGLPSTLATRHFDSI